MTPSLAAATLLALIVPALAVGAVQAAAPASLPSPAASPSPEPLTAVVETDAGVFAIRLLPDLAPAHVRHFVAVAKKGGYDRTTFHRIIPGGLVQGGDPLSKDPARSAAYGTGGLGLLKAEFSDRPFLRGAVGAVRRPSSRDSAGNQFFVCLREQPALQGQYTLFGEVVEGMDVLDRIGQTPVERDRAQQRVEIRSVQLRPAAGSP